METCENCGRKIGNLEEPHIWNDRVVCRECHGRLDQGNEQPSAEIDEGDTSGDDPSRRDRVRVGGGGKEAKAIAGIVGWLGAILVVLGAIALFDFREVGCWGIVFVVAGFLLLLVESLVKKR